ncbi:hypothetical protein ALC53_02845 [Atta colombica]|uniref:Uncharacterized protein n=1 Tax=Atta colombica TaxID=520822 RepID=A0A195BPC0_9HYME|nr:hypothetical protein ALC53_02845 [Atta colombica]
MTLATTDFVDIRRTDHDGYLEFTFCSLLVAAILKINSTKSNKTCPVRHQCASPANSSPDKFPRAQDLGG